MSRDYRGINDEKELLKKVEEAAAKARTAFSNSCVFEDDDDEAMYRRL